MINKKDIEARNQINPEPLEVTKTRALITDTFEDLEFIEETHQYFVGEDELPPVSTICHGFQPYVDWDSIAEKKAAKLGIPVETLKEDWHKKNITSTSCGSKTHWFGEQMMNLFIGREVQLPFQYTPDGYMIPYAPKEKAIEAYWESILSNPRVYPVMPEAKIYLREIDGVKIMKPYAGTFDILMAYKMGDGRVAYSIHDYKSNVDLKNDFNRFKGNHLLEPFTDLIDEPLSIYSIQLSLYQLGLQQLGLEIVDRNLIWLKEDGTFDKVPVPDLTERLLKTL